MSLSAWTSNVPRCETCKNWVGKNPSELLSRIRWCDIPKNWVYGLHWCPEWRSVDDKQYWTSEQIAQIRADADKILANMRPAKDAP